MTRMWIRKKGRNWMKIKKFKMTIMKVGKLMSRSKSKSTWK